MRYRTIKFDVVFINAPAGTTSYQGLRSEYSAIEPPVWALLLAQSVRSFGYQPAILDANAEGLSTAAAAEKALRCSTRLFCLTVYGQNPNAGTVNMTDAVALANSLRQKGIKTPICMVGSHASALPTQVLETEPAIDIVLCNEGVYALRNLLALDCLNPAKLQDVRGIGYRENGKAVLTKPERVVPQDRMDIDLPGYAWDLLPYREKPLDLYRAHFWHADYDHNKRTPFAAIYTSLGCTFKCGFCMINIVNRNDTEEVGDASNYSGMRFWSPEFIFNEFEKLFEMGVRTLRISDEMFLLNARYFVPLCEMLRDKGYGRELNMWAYSRVDTVRKPKHLQLLRSAGIKWLALGIESGSRKIRLEASKGKYEEVDIHRVVSDIERADINVIANYLFGLPGDTLESMQATLELSLELCTTAWNGYPVMALPGSPIYRSAQQEGRDLPRTYSSYSFLGYDSEPLPTDELTPGDILDFRDQAYSRYHGYAPFLEKVEKRCGRVARSNIEKMANIKLARRLLEHRS